MAFVEKDLSFNSSFVGISSPAKDKDELRGIYERVCLDEKTSSLYKSFLLATSSKSVVYHEKSLVKEDFDDLPYPDNPNDLSLSNSEKILVDDILDYYRHLGKGISNRAEGFKLHISASQKQLKDYGETICTELNDIYNKQGCSWQSGKVLQSQSSTIYQIGYGLNGKLKQEFGAKELEKTVQSLIFPLESNSENQWRQQKAPDKQKLLILMLLCNSIPNR